MAHICINHLIIIDSDNGLSPVQCQATMWINDSTLSWSNDGLLYWMNSKFLIEIHTSLFKKMRLSLLQNVDHFVYASVYLYLFQKLKFLLLSPCNTETEMSSFWRNFHHWLHRKLSKWQLSVQSVIKISSKWQHFRFSEHRHDYAFIHFEAETNGWSFCRRHFQRGFLRWKSIESRLQLHWKNISKSPVNKKSVLFQVMTWCRTGDKPLSELMMTSQSDANKLCTIRSQ